VSHVIFINAEAAQCAVVVHKANGSLSAQDLVAIQKYQAQKAGALG
jgi:hypothetical protein